MKRTFIVEIDDSLRGAEVDIDELERKWGAEEVKTGHWIEAGKDDPWWYFCSECHAGTDDLSNFCANCGVAMSDKVERIRE